MKKCVIQNINNIIILLYIYHLISINIIIVINEWSRNEEFISQGINDKCICELLN